MPTVEELKAQMAEAVKAFNASGDMTKIQEVSNAMNKAKGEFAKAEAAKLLKESEALAGKRESLAIGIHEIIRKQGFDKLLNDVKAWGFTYKVNRANPAELDIDYKSVSLSTQTVKARKAGGGGGNGKSKDEYGLSLQEIVDKYGTAEELAAIGAEGISNSKSWQLKQAVKKQAIAAGKLAPVK